MNCPYCQQPLKEKEVTTTDHQTTNIYECLHCGSHFLPDNLANFLSEHEAKNIDSIIPEKDISNPPQELLCPLCQQHLITISDDSVPKDVTIFACPQNHGHFFQKGELLKFKQAQSAKLNYLKAWNIPLASVFAVLLPILVIFSVATIIPLTVNQTQKSQETRTKASELLTSPLITSISPTETVISFSTKNPYVTHISFSSLNQPISTINISSQPQTDHVITLTNLFPQTKYQFTLSLSSTDSATITTDTYTFSTP